MERKSIRLSTLGLGALALICWVVMFLAGTDVWHDIGRPDFRNQGASNVDVQALTYAFYLLPFVLAGHLLATVYGIVTARRRDRLSGA